MTRTRIATQGLADASVTDAKIAGVAAGKLTGQIATNQIADGAVTDAKIAGVAAGKLTGQIATNQIADGAVTDAKIAGMAATKLTGTVAFARLPVGSTSTTVCVGNDSRLADSRTPTSHTHGNITNAGAIGSATGQIVVTTTGGVLTTASTIAAASVSGLAASATTDTTNASNIIAGTLDAARIGAHTHTALQISDSTAAGRTLLTAATLAAQQSTLQIGFQCRAFVNFAGNLNTSGAADANNTARLLRSSGNIASVTRTGVGQYTIAFTTAMPDTAYVVIGMSDGLTAASSYAVHQVGAGSTGSVSIAAKINNTLTDLGIIMVAVFR